MSIDITLRNLVKEIAEEIVVSLPVSTNRVMSRAEIVDYLGVSDNQFTFLCQKYKMPYYALGKAKRGYLLSEVLSCMRQEHSSEG